MSAGSPQPIVPLGYNCRDVKTEGKRLLGLGMGSGGCSEGWSRIGCSRVGEDLGRMQQSR